MLKLMISLESHHIREPLSKSLETLSPRDLELYQYDLEQHYRQLILKSVKGSEERRHLFDLAYRDVFKVLFELRRRNQKSSLDGLGGDSSIANLITEFLHNKPSKVFEVGCGTGSVLEGLVKKGHQVGGCDLSNEAIQVCHDRLPEFKDKIQCINFFDLNMPESYDLVYSNDVLEHFHPDEVQDFLKKVISILRPGGYLWLITPNRYTGPGDGTAYRNPEATSPEGLHLKEYSLNELCKLLNSAGFSSLSTRLWTKGRLRPIHSPFREEFVIVKRMLEPFFALLPKKLRHKFFFQLKYSEIIAKK